jgi:predicted PurR-regulated permease PerM
LRERLPNALAAGATLLAFLGAIVLLGWLIVPPIADETATLGQTVSEAIDDIEEWLVTDSPFDVSREAIDRLRERASDWFQGLLRSSGSQVVDGATLLAEIVAGLFLAVLFTFFLLRDGPRFARWLHSRVPPRHRDGAHRAATSGWSVLGLYLRGAAILGVVESIAIGLALWLAGGSLVGPVMIVTFLAAFVPILGAIVAGVIAVLVALVTGGATTALIVAIVALAVQQLDNDLLAPWIYGRAFSLHPMVILVSVVAGGALFGIAGTLLAVPVVAVAVAVVRALRGSEDEAEATA